MKKGKLKKILATSAMGIMALAMPFTLTGCDKDADINVRVDGDYIQWQVEGDSDWTNLLTIEEVKDLLGESVKGDTGAQGQQGNPGINGREVEFRVTETHIQWRYVDNSQGEDENWEDLTLLSSLKGDDGIDGREVEFRKTEYSIQWRYKNAPQGSEDSWKFLVSLDDIKGKDGADGTDGSTWYCGSGVPDPDSDMLFYAKYGDYYLDASSSTIYKLYTTRWIEIAKLKTDTEVEVSFDTNLPAYMYEFFDEYGSISTKTIDKGSWCDLEDFSNSKLSRYFLGWYVGDGVDETKITSYTSISKDCTLKAKWDYEEIDKYYTSDGVELYYNGFGVNGGPCTAQLTSKCGEVVHIAEYWDCSSMNSKGSLVYKVSNISCPAKATNTKELILPATASINGFVSMGVSDDNNSIEKVSWFGEEKLRIIGLRSFFNCHALKEVELPSSVQEIEYYAFYGCENLTKINLKNIKTIYDYAFADCTSLNYANLESVETIKEYAFYNCSSLTENCEDELIGLTIPKTVSEIGNNAFEGCVSLAMISIDSTIIANLKDNNSYLFSYADWILVYDSIEIDETAYISNAQGNFLKSDGGDWYTSYYVLDKVIE